MFWVQCNGVGLGRDIKKVLIIFFSFVNENNQIENVIPIRKENRIKKLFI